MLKLKDLMTLCEIVDNSEYTDCAVVFHNIIDNKDIFRISAQDLLYCKEYNRLVELMFDDDTEMITTFDIERAEDTDMIVDCIVINVTLSL